MATKRIAKRPNAAERKLALTQAKLTKALDDVEELKRLNQAGHETLTLARQANALHLAHLAHASALLRSAADQLEVRGAVPTARLFRAEADKLDPPSRTVRDCQGETMTPGFKAALASLGKDANLQLADGNLRAAGRTR